jgi:CHAT domain-containing protein
MQILHKFLYRSGFTVVVGCLCLADMVVAQQPASTVTQAPQVNSVLRRVEVRGTTVIPQKIVSEIFSPQYGKTLNLKAFNESIKKLTQWYIDNGYVLAQVVNTPKVSSDGVVELQVAEGVIENIQVRFVDKQGNVVAGKAPTDIILKQAVIKVGQVFNRNQIQKDLQTIFDLGIFNDLNIKLEPGKDAGKVIVFFDAVENDSASAFSEFVQKITNKRNQEAEMFRWKGHQATSSDRAGLKAVEHYQAALKLFQKQNDTTGAAKVYNNIGNAYKEQKEYDKAISNFQNSLKLYKSQNNKLQQAIVHNNLGNTYVQNEKYDEAIDTYDQAQKLFAEVNEPFWQALSLSNLGYSYFYADNKDKAIEYYQQAMLSWKNVKQTNPGKKYISNSVRQTTSLALNLATSSTRGTYFEASIQLDDALEFPLDDKRLWMKGTLFNYANAFQASGDYQQAMYAYNDALFYWQAVKKDKTLTSIADANYISIINILFDAVGQFAVSNFFGDIGQKQLSSRYKQQIIDTLKKDAPALYTQLSEGRDKSSALNTLLLSFAPVILNVFNQQDTDATTSLFKDFDMAPILNEITKQLNDEQGLKEYQNLKTVSQPFLQYLTTSINNSDAEKLAKIQDNTKKQQALELYQKNLVLLNNVKDENLCFDKLLNAVDKDGKLLNQLKTIIPNMCMFSARTQNAQTLNHIAKLQLELNQNQQAIQSLTQSLSLLQTDSTKPLENTKLGQESTQKLIEQISNASKNSNSDNLKQLSNLFDYLNKGFANNKVIEAKKTTAETLLLMGQAYTAQQQYQQALGFYSSSFALYKEIDDIIKQADTRLGMATVERKRGNLTLAKTQVERAIEIIESQRAQESNKKPESLNNDDKNKAPEVKQKPSSYKAYLDLAKYLESKQNYYDFYIDLLMQLHTQQPKQGYDVLAFQASEGSKSRSLRAIVSRSLKQNNKTNTSTNQLETNYLEIAKVPTLSEIQQLLDNNTILLEYALGEERSYLWAVTQNSIHTYQLPKRSDIDKLSRQFIDLLKSPSYRLGTRGISVAPGADATKLPEVANQLSDILVAPVLEKLGNKRLLVVTDGALQYIPFAAIPKSSQDKEIKPLLVDHEIVGLPSASLQILSQRRNPRGKVSKTLAMLADPIFSRNDERVKNPNPSNNIINTAPLFNRLPGTRKEASQISSLIPDSEKLVKFDAAANYSTATSNELSKYRFIHFATHGVFDSERPERSGVIFSSVNEKGEPQRSLLSTPDAFKLKLSSDLVVLSACTTALGQEIKGEGLIGVTGGLMYAGSKSVVSSFWDVDDGGTAELMSQFYINMLKQKQSPATALRNAQLYMWNTSQWQAPYYWAAFSIQGITTK